MKKLFYLLAAVLLFSCGKKPVDINVMTFNIRLDTPADSLNNWQYRKDQAAAVVKAQNIDILGMQEVLVNQLKDLKERLPEYNSIGVGRQDGKEAGEFSPVFYKKDRFTEVESGNFWLSETPDSIGVKGWDAACERVATWAILKEKETDREFFVLNTHLDHVGQVARLESIKLLLAKSAELSKGLPIIMTGDFNANPESDVIKLMTASQNEKYLIDSKAIATTKAGESSSFNNFGRIPMEERQLIDYVFVSDKLIDVLKYEVLPEKFNDVFVSDHNPVSVQLRIK